MSIFESILIFSETRPLWQQDIMRRLFTQDEFTVNDLDDALLMLKAHYDVISKKEAPIPSALSAKHLPEIRSSRLPVILNSLDDIKNVNKLAKEQKLPFATDGITIIYGDNGSGKSGYCRILKKICRVRVGGEEHIHGDAFATEEYPPAEALVRFTIDTKDAKDLIALQWVDGNGPIEMLSKISVFDVRTTPLYGDKEGKIDFLPQGLDVLQRIGNTCRDLISKLDQEIITCKKQVSVALPVFPSLTKISTVIDRITPNVPLRQIPSKEEIVDHAKWDKEIEKELEALETELRTDPQILAKKCRIYIKSIEQFIGNISSAEKALNDTALMELKTKKEAARSSRQISNMAASEAFKDEPLEGVGSEPWRRLFHYAREYSAIAYRDEPFPVTGEEKYCLLCQQPLNEEASERMKRFDTFIKDTAQKEAERCEKEWDQALYLFRALTIRQRNDAETSLVGVDEIDNKSKGLNNEIADYLDVLSERQQTAIKSFIEEMDFNKISIFPESILQKLTSAAERLRVLSQDYEKEGSNPEIRKAFEKKRDELLARKRLSENIDIVLGRRDEIEKLLRLTRCKEACDTREISLKTTELRRQIITKTFEDGLMSEIRNFHLSYLPLRITDRSERAESYIGVALDCRMQIVNSDILSEGEFRGLALACFLAEINNIEGHDGIIVDDPVSSLDHLHTERVAERLVNEGKKRQVIIFTHDLLFYHALINSAIENDVPVYYVWLQNTTKGIGTVYEKEQPWESKKVSQRIDHLFKQIKDIEKVEKPSGEKYRLAVKGFYSCLRDTWERLVEELLLNSVSSRFQKEVKTLSLKGVNVNDEDYKRIFVNVKKVSKYCHDQPPVEKCSLPKTSEMEEDLNKLKEYAYELKTWKNKLEEHRKRLEKPPEATVI